jgi:hypothetical protein
MAIILKRASKLPFAPIAAGLFALAAATLVMATPVWMLESLAERSGIASVLSAAQPPLGMKARALMAIMAALGTGAVVWAAMIPITKMLERKGRVSARPLVSNDLASNDDVPSPIARDQAGARRSPIFADRELGAPFMSEQALADAPMLMPQNPESVDPDELVLDAAFMGSEAATPMDASSAQPISPATPSHATPAYEIPAYQPRAYMPPAPAADPDDHWHNAAPSPVDAAPNSVSFDEIVLDETAHADAASDAPGADVLQDVIEPGSAIPVPPPVQARHAETISELVERLESGLKQRAAALAAAQAAADAAIAAQAVHNVAPAASAPRAATPPLAAAQRDVDSALTQALSTLERLATASR